MRGGYQRHWSRASRYSSGANVQTQASCNPKCQRIIDGTPTFAARATSDQGQTLPGARLLRPVGEWRESGHVRPVRDGRLRVDDPTCASLGNHACIEQCLWCPRSCYRRYTAGAASIRFSGDVVHQPFLPPRVVGPQETKCRTTLFARTMDSVRLRRRQRASRQTGPDVLGKQVRPFSVGAMSPHGDRTLSRRSRDGLCAEVTEAGRNRDAGFGTDVTVASS